MGVEQTCEDGCRQRIQVHNHKRTNLGININNHGGESCQSVVDAKSGIRELKISGAAALLYFLVRVDNRSGGNEEMNRPHLAGESTFDFLAWTRNLGCTKTTRQSAYLVS